ncbi:MAG TPA: glycosyltransferase [Phycisphaerales bacterium]|nr:glycosyltransferase [Phycisphaerales bacterium]
MRLALFTDTLGDVNGVSRFLTTLAAHAHHNNLPLLILTSTRLRVPSFTTIANIPPRFATPIPRYPQLQLALPSRRALAAAADAFKPTHIHVSTPGPVGLLGRAYALKRRLPLAATYHTDFPAYIHHLFDHESLTAITSAAMRWFYKPARTIFSRSSDYAARLRALGFPESRLARLRPGIDLDLFSPPSPGPAGEDVRRFGRTYEGALDGIGLRSVLPSLHLLYTGRISVEKNLPFLTSLWPRTHAALRTCGIRATLTITGEGPYEPAMRAALAHHGTRFTGVLRGRALADVYRSADLFLFPSTTDTLGQAVMEAQACGVPCLISPTGGPREITIPNQSSLVLPIRAASWHNAILQLANDSDKRAAMSHAAANNGACYPFATSAEHFWASHALSEPDAPAREARSFAIDAPFMVSAAATSTGSQLRAPRNH